MLLLLACSCCWGTGAAVAEAEQLQHDWVYSNTAIVLSIYNSHRRSTLLLLRPVVVRSFPPTPPLRPPPAHPHRPLRFYRALLLPARFHYSLL